MTTLRRILQLSAQQAPIGDETGETAAAKDDSMDIHAVGPAASAEHQRLRDEAHHERKKRKKKKLKSEEDQLAVSQHSKKRPLHDDHSNKDPDPPSSPRIDGDGGGTPGTKKIKLADEQTATPTESGATVQQPVNDVQPPVNPPPSKVAKQPSDISAPVMVFSAQAGDPAPLEDRHNGETAGAQAPASKGDQSDTTSNTQATPQEDAEPKVDGKTERVKAAPMGASNAASTTPEAAVTSETSSAQAAESGGDAKSERRNKRTDGKRKERPSGNAEDGGAPKASGAVKQQATKTEDAGAPSQPPQPTKATKSLTPSLPVDSELLKSLRPPPRNASKRCPGGPEAEKKEKKKTKRPKPGTVDGPNSRSASPSLAGSQDATRDGSTGKLPSADRETGRKGQNQDKEGKKGGSAGDGKKEKEPRGKDGKRGSDIRPDRESKKEVKGVAKAKFNWVMCDRCSKWRQIPGFVDVEALNEAENWFCEMNEWDPERATCNAPEHSGDANTTRTKSGKGRGKGRGKNGKESPTTISDARDVGKDGEGSGRGRKGSKKNKGGKRGANAEDASQVAGSAAGAAGKDAQGGTRGDRPSNMIAPQYNGKQATGTWQWVMCETCQQWRKLPPEVDVAKLPEKWYCSMNKWDPSRATCSAPQEADDQKILIKQQEEQEAMRNQVRLPDGVNLYGGQFLGTSNRKLAPTNYRELIVNHYRHFRNWDQVANSMCNARYGGTSLFVPRGQHRRNRKWKLLNTPSTLYTVLLKDNQSEETPKATDDDDDELYEDLLESGEPLVSQLGKSMTLEEICAPQGVDGHGTGVGHLKLAKPWKRFGGWQDGDKYGSSE